MIQSPLLSDATLLHVDDIAWDDIAHIETPRRAHSLLKFSGPDVLYVRQSFQIQNRLQDQWRRGYLGQNFQKRDQEREWLLEEVEQGRAYLRVKDPFAPVARWQANNANPLGGDWQKLSHREFGFEPVGIFWLHQRIDHLMRLRLTDLQTKREKAPQETRPRQATREKETEKHSLRWQFLSPITGEPLAGIPYKIFKDKSEVASGQTEGDGRTARYHSEENPEKLKIMIGEGAWGVLTVADQQPVRITDDDYDEDAEDDVDDEQMDLSENDENSEEGVA